MKSHTYSYETSPHSYPPHLGCSNSFYKREQSQIACNFSTKNVDILKSIEWNFTEAKASPFSSIHPYPAKFINEIPATLIKNLWHGQGDFVLDPFCGSGVTLEEAQRRGISSVGIDLNPIACLISRVRTNQLPEAFLNICEAIVKDCQTLDTIIEVPALPNIDHWFKADIQEALAKLKHSIDNYKGTEVYDALLYCFSSIIVKVSNQDSDTRYAFRDKGKTASDVYSYFLLSARKLTKAMMGNPHAEARVLNKNSLKLTSEDLPGKIGLVVTSPPYPNAYEYWLYHKYRMYWLGFNPIQVKNEEIGARAQYFKKSKYEGYDFAIQMSELLSMLYPYCSDDAYLCFVIGRSKIHGEIYCNDKIIAEIGMNAGFRHITTLQREINCKRKSFNLSHARIKDEYIVILQK